MLHDKTDGSAMSATTKAMIELLGLANCKRRGFFVVERTAGNIIGACLFQWDVSFNHIHDVEAVEQILNETFWNHVNSAPARNT